VGELLMFEFVYEDEAPAPADVPAPAAEVAPAYDLGRTCQCLRTRGQGEGFTNSDTGDPRLWVHVACRNPTKEFAESLARRTA
jgi:hypothetical protein